MSAAQTVMLGADWLSRLAGTSSPGMTADCAGVAHRWNVPVRTVTSVAEKRLEDDLARFSPDWIVAIFFNQIVPGRVRAPAGRGALNVHPSFLPANRGVSPCFWILAHGEETAGVTVHRLTDQLDRGTIVGRALVRVRPSDTVFSLYRACALRGADLLLSFLKTGRAPVAQLPVADSYRSEITPGAVRSLRRRRRFFLFA
jgi:methionyl-tRNA formyltransferase